MDPVTVIGTAVQSIKVATDIAKLLKDADFSLKDAEAKLKLADMINALADAKLEMAQIQEAIAERDETIRGLREELSIKGQMQYEEPFYYRVQEGRRDGPYCQNCYDSQGKPIRLQGRGNDCWQCLNCNSFFQTPGSTPPSDHSEPYDPLTHGRA